MRLGVNPDVSRFQATMAKLRRVGADLTPLMTQIGTAALDQMGDAFDDEGAGKWEPLAPGTVKIKERKFPGTPIMVRTGTMRHSLNVGGKDNIFQPGPLGAQVGSAVPWVFKHQEGAEGLPERPIIFVAPGFEGKAADMAEAYLRQQIQQ